MSNDNCFMNSLIYNPRNIFILNKVFTVKKNYTQTPLRIIIMVLRYHGNVYNPRNICIRNTMF